MDAFVARQPIFDLHKRVLAYELLFRDGPANLFPGSLTDVLLGRPLAEVLERLTIAGDIPAALLAGAGPVDWARQSLHAAARS